jgi:hypothetical protein
VEKRTWIAERLLPGMGAKQRSRRWAGAFSNLEGWLAYGWPKEFAGPGWTAVQTIYGLISITT